MTAVSACWVIIIASLDNILMMLHSLFLANVICRIIAPRARSRCGSLDHRGFTTARRHLPTSSTGFFSTCGFLTSLPSHHHHSVDFSNGHVAKNQVGVRVQSAAPWLAVLGIPPACFLSV